MHSIHTTPGFIISVRPYGESGGIFQIFTLDFGLIFAAAQGIRLEKSKLRYYSQEYSFGIFSLVKGKEYWRLTSAREMFINSSVLSKEKNEIIASIALLLKRLLHGEESQPMLFEYIKISYRFLCDVPGLEVNRLKTLETTTVIRILNALGYIGDDPLLDKRLNSFTLNIELLDDLSRNRALLNKHINKAFRESHL